MDPLANDPQDTPEPDHPPAKDAEGGPGAAAGHSKTAVTVRILLIVLAVACAAFVYVVRSGMLEEITRPKRDLPEEYEVPEGYRGVVLVFLDESTTDSATQADAVTGLGREYRGKLAFVRLEMKKDEVLARQLGVVEKGPSLLFFDRDRRLKSTLPVPAAGRLVTETIERFL